MALSLLFLMVAITKENFEVFTIRHPTFFLRGLTKSEAILSMGFHGLRVMDTSIVCSKHANMND